MIEPNQVYNLDCLEGLKLMPEECVDLVVTDPPYGYSFMGSGTTALACVEFNRNYVGFELLKEYCDIINARLKQEIQTKLEVV